MFFYSVDFLYSQLHTNEVWLDRMKWLANICVMLSAILVSSSVALSTQPLTFIGFLVAHVLWLIAGMIMKDKPIMALNAFFIIIDMYAIIIRL